MRYNDCFRGGDCTNCSRDRWRMSKGLIEVAGVRTVVSKGGFLGRELADWSAQMEPWDMVMRSRTVSEVAMVTEREGWALASRSRVMYRREGSDSEEGDGKWWEMRLRGLRLGALDGMKWGGFGFEENYDGSPVCEAI